jgi:hypothetical protein
MSDSFEFNKFIDKCIEEKTSFKWFQILGFIKRDADHFTIFINDDSGGLLLRDCNKPEIEMIIAEMQKMIE